MALFQQTYAMSQHLFQSRVAFIFGRDFVFMTAESNHSFSLFQQIPKTFNGVKSGLCGGQFMCENDSLCSPDTLVSSCSTLSQLQPDESWHCCPGIYLSHQGRNNNLVIQYIQELC